MFEGGILKGAAVSLVIHLLAFVATFAAYRFTASHLAVPRLCKVSLVSLGGPGNSGGGGAAGRGDNGGGPEAAKKAEIVETPPETPPVLPAPKDIRKPAVVRKPKPKPLPVSPPKQSPIQAETPSSTVLQKDSENAKAFDGQLPGQGPGPGPGPGGENAGPGSGTGSGPGGGGEGPINSTFGSGDGPSFARRVLPNYPMMARQLGREGSVLLQITIDERGRLVGVELVKKAGSGFDEEALRAIRSSTFRPAMRNGKPVSCKARLPIHFVLKDAHE